jgi:ElaB/YqjD/DUF883 family membrane-anchored ribosome-binding protein
LPLKCNLLTMFSASGHRGAKEISHSGGSIFAAKWQRIAADGRSKGETVANEDFDSARSAFDGDTISNAAARVQDQAAKYGQKAVEAVDASRDSAASTLDNAAAGIRAKADDLPGGRQVSQFARQAADTLDTTADYLREHEVKDMMSDLTRFIKAHPTGALIGAAVVGFLAGRSARN